MTKSNLIIAAFAAAFVSAPAMAENAAPQAPKERRICRSATATGSIMAKRTCRTASEWQAIERATAAQSSRAMEERDRSFLHALRLRFHA